MAHPNNSGVDDHARTEELGTETSGVSALVDGKKEPIVDITSVMHSVTDSEKEPRSSDNTPSNLAENKAGAEADLPLERPQTQRRMNALMVYVRARVGAPTGLPTELRPIDAEIAADLGVSRAWIYRKMNEVIERGWQNATIEDFAIGKPDGGRGESRLDSAVKAALDESIAHVCVRNGKKPGSRGAAKAIMARMMTHHKIPEAKVPERPTISKWSKADHITAQRAGPYAANILNRPALVMEEPDAVLARVFLDWTLFTQDDRKLIVTTEGDRDIGPAHLVSALDEATRLLWGWKWCVCTPNSFVIGQAIHCGTISKQPLLEKLGLRGRILHGRPLLVRHDNGSDMISQHTKRVIEECDITFDDRSPVRTPNYNGVQERWHGTAKGMFLDFLSDLAEDKALCARHHIRVDPKSGDVRVRWSHLEPLWVQWVVERYSTRSHKGLGGKTPLQRLEAFEDGNNQHMSGIHPAMADTVEHRWRFLESEFRIVNQCGIQIKNISYSHPDLRNLFVPGRRRSRTKIEIRRNRHALRQVFVKDTKTGQIITVPVVSPRNFTDCTEAEWNLAQKDMKRAGTEPQPQAVAELLSSRRSQSTTPSLASNKGTRADRANHATHQSDKAFFTQAPPKAPTPLVSTATSTQAPVILPSGNDAIGF